MTPPVKIPRASTLDWRLLCTLAVYSFFALITAETTKFMTYRLWAHAAAPAYAAAAAILVIAGIFGVSSKRVRTFSLLVAVFGSDVLPLVQAVRRHLAMPEIDVIRRAGQQLLAHGTPFSDSHSLLYDYNPYLPGMAVLGLISRVTHIDLRLIFVAFFLICVTVANRRNSSNLAAILICPFIAIPLVAGGDDLPVLGLIYLSLTLATSGTQRGRFASALAIGIACGLKAIAFPALPVVLALVGRVHGRRAFVQHTVVSVAMFALLVVPAFVRSPHAFIENAVKFPLGMAALATTAQDPLPGHLIASHIPGGKFVVLALLLVAGAGIALMLMRKPPRDIRTAANQLALGLIIAIALAPAPRWGYFIYPAGLLLWAGIIKREAAVPLVSTPTVMPTAGNAPVIDVRIASTKAS